MVPDPTRTRVLSPSVAIEVGQSSWSSNETSIRRRVDGDTGRFSPHGSSELPLEDLQPLMEVAAQYDLIEPAACAAIIDALAASIRRRASVPPIEPPIALPDERTEELSAEAGWPRYITIRAKIETARRYLGEDYDEDHEGDDALLNEVGESMETIEIHSWEELEIPDGYEIADEDDRDEYDAWRESNRRS